MAIHFKHKSEAELQAERILPKGEYQFKIVEAEEREGKSCQYFRLRLSMSLGQRNITWYDNIVMSEMFMWRVRHACEEMRLLKQYESDCLEAKDFIGKQGILIIDHKVNKETGEVECYVKDYGVRIGTKSPSINHNSNKVVANLASSMPADYEVYSQINRPKTESNLVDDDIPFI